MSSHSILLDACAENTKCEGSKNSSEFNLSYEMVAIAPTVSLVSLELQERFSLRGQGDEDVSPYGSTLEVARTVIAREVEVKGKMIRTQIGRAHV